VEVFERRGRRGLCVGKGGMKWTRDMQEEEEKSSSKS